MQWALAFLEPPPPVKKTLSSDLDANARVEALNILARMIAQAKETAKPNEESNERHFQNRFFASEPHRICLSSTIVAYPSPKQPGVYRTTVRIGFQGEDTGLVIATDRRHR